MSQPEENPRPIDDPQPDAGADDDPFGHPVPQTEEPEDPPSSGG